MNGRNNLTIVFLLIITVCISWGFYFHDYHASDRVQVKDLSLILDKWTCQNLPVDPVQLNVLGTKNAMVRRFTDEKGRTVTLSVVYSESNPQVSDPPEVLYLSSSADIIDRGKKYLTIAFSKEPFEVNWLLIDDHNRRQLVYYWYKVDGANTHSYFKERAIAAYENLIGRQPGIALIRISTEMKSNRKMEAVNLINSFACLIIPQLIQQIP